MQDEDSIKNALLILKKNLQEIHTVSEWAEIYSYSRGYFSILIKEEFNETPYQIICREKYRKVYQLVCEDPYCKGYIIAQKVGFPDVKSLYKFLKTHYNTSLTALRETVKRTVKE